METQEIHTSDPCPKGIVNQLLEIAKENDAMNEIGGATGWRWQEGIISRMPKKHTVAKILKKAYGTDNPSVWLNLTSGDLKMFIKNAFNLGAKVSRDYKILNIYEALIIISTHDANGITFDELVFRLSYLRFCKTSEFDNEHFIAIDETLILSLYKPWAMNKAKELIQKFNFELDEQGYYSSKVDVYFTDTNLHFFQLEIFRYRLKAVGGNSNFDMWRTNYVALSDDEMIEVEYKMIEYQKLLLKEIKSSRERNLADRSLRKTRVFNMSCISLPKKAGESLKWLQ